MRAFLTALVVAASVPVLAGPNEAKLARDAFYAIEAEPFSADVINAAKDIETAMRKAEDEPWVLIARSRALLEAGYRKGDRSRLSSYGAQEVELAVKLARRAVEKAPQESMAHVQVARLQIITDDLRGAWETLNSAYRLDPKNFYPWYYRGVIALRMNDAKRAGDAFDAAEKLAAMPYQKEWAVGRRLDIARLNKDPAAEESLHRQIIASRPQSAHAVGNYAAFLKRHKRYDEAIEQYRKALAIASYPLAEEQLRQTMLLRDAVKR